jgi:hypothetical protein
MHAYPSKYLDILEEVGSFFAMQGRHLLTCGLGKSCSVFLDIGANLAGLFRYIRG